VFCFSLFNDLSDFIDTEDATIFNLPPLDESSNVSDDSNNLLGVVVNEQSVLMIIIVTIVFTCNTTF